MWFAFKLCSLYIWLQLPGTTYCLKLGCDLLSNFALCTFDYNPDNEDENADSCDLLSNFALCTFDYNPQQIWHTGFGVVICFQTLLFVHLITTPVLTSCALLLLWFAFKLCSLYIWLQPWSCGMLSTIGCDLLSNFALCTFDYNM